GRVRPSDDVLVRMTHFSPPRARLRLACVAMLAIACGSEGTLLAVGGQDATGQSRPAPGLRWASWTATEELTGQRDGPQSASRSVAEEREGSRLPPPGEVHGVDDPIRFTAAQCSAAGQEPPPVAPAGALLPGRGPDGVLVDDEDVHL